MIFYSLSWFCLYCFNHWSNEFMNLSVISFGLVPVLLTYYMYQFNCVCYSLLNWYVACVWKLWLFCTGLVRTWSWPVLISCSPLPLYTSSIRMPRNVLRNGTSVVRDHDTIQYVPFRKIEVYLQYEIKSNKTLKYSHITKSCLEWLFSACTHTCAPAHTSINLGLYT